MSIDLLQHSNFQASKLFISVPFKGSQVPLDHIGFPGPGSHLSTPRSQVLLWGPGSHFSGMLKFSAPQNKIRISGLPDSLKL